MDQEQLRNLENQCIQEWAPRCQASCPVHVDVRAMAAAISMGDFDKALGILRQRVPFPEIISRICDHPCQDSCIRIDLDSSIAINELEYAAVTNSLVKLPSVKPLPSKGKKVAVVGAGLSGLTGAFDLAKKGVSVTIFEARDRLGGSLWRYPEEELPRDIMEKDFEILNALAIDYVFNTTIGKTLSLEELCADHDGVYLGPGDDALGITDDLDVVNNTIVVDPLTFETSKEGIFAGGFAITGLRSPIESVSTGRRAAISLDRYLKRVSLGASREYEGAYETRLHTSLEGVNPSPRVARKGSPYSKESASIEAARCLQCECKECVKVCRYLEEFKSYPKQYIRRIYNNLSIVAGQRHANMLINSCSLCGLCREVCPEDLNMATVCKAARETMIKQDRMPPSAHEFALRDMEFSNSNLFALWRHQKSRSKSEYLFFPGCRLSGSAPDNTVQIYKYLQDKLQGGVGVGLGCCGAPADWSGRSELFEQSFQNLLDQWRNFGEPKIVAACSTCHQIFKGRLPEDKVVSLWSILDEVGPPQISDKPGPFRLKLALHDPCSSRHEKSIHESVRSILHRLGIDIFEFPLNRDRTECCSFGGLTLFANRELADRIIERRTGRTELDIVAYCSMCRDQYAMRGKPTWHLLDLIFQRTREESAESWVDYSQSRENRARVKRTLQIGADRDISSGSNLMEGPNLEISEEIRFLMEKRMILKEDIRTVIQWAEETGSKLVNNATGHYLAHYRPGTVTYWVEYSTYGDRFVIHNAYCHRMEVLEDTTN